MIRRRKQQSERLKIAFGLLLIVFSSVMYGGLETVRGCANVARTRGRR